VLQRPASSAAFRASLVRLETKKVKLNKNRRYAILLATLYPAFSIYEHGIDGLFTVDSLAFIGIGALAWWYRGLKREYCGEWLNEKPQGWCQSRLL